MPVPALIRGIVIVKGFIMQAWQFVEVGSPLTLNEVEAPTPAANEVVVDVKAAGLCHSDVGFLDGTLTPLLPFRPITLGHEIAGIVSAVGSDVADFKVGDKVAIPAAIEGPGTEKNGGFATQVVVLERLVVPVPESVPFDQAAAATDAGMTSYHAVMVQGRVTAGSKVGIIGLGGLGMMGAQAALAAGADVYVAEINEKVHQVARDLGATGVSTDIRDFSDQGLDVVIDFAGFGTTTDAAVETVRRGGRVVQVGLGVARGEINLQQLTLNEVELVGSQAGTKEDCIAVLDLVAAGKLSSRVTTISFDEIGEGIGKLERGEVIGRLVAVLG
ncbi:MULTISPECIES: zinc-binding dehydrogenase [unclassified Salinibacterium]|uniref:zinc-binding dehydrogenase n=1 Tax=unclassified Salinibacterium TaxID=2632331 RepID=UPI001CD4AAB2|nr:MULTISPECIES: zinc-binding dehydrogenase [unclassified Salinibacterium]